jgi:hypothetical protein
MAPRAAKALDNPFPDHVLVCPGIKLGYTFGDEGGFTVGGEISMLFRNGPDAGLVLADGPVLNFGWASRGVFQLRAGYELASWVVGLEGGPALVSDRTGTHFAIGVTPWLGAIFAAPYYTHAFVFGAPSVDEIGTYLKLPLCFGCPGGGGGHGSFFGGLGHDHHH